MNPELILDPLNAAQREAVSAPDANLLVLAGAGSGKTRVLVHRIAWLVHEFGVMPFGIMAVTFTNKAAAEMRDRLHEMIGESARDVAMGTFHSLCARMLRRDGEAIGLPKGFTIYDADDQARVIKGFLKEDDLPATGETKPSLILGAISRAKNDGLTAEQMEDRAITHHERLVARFARRYAAELKRLDALDFDWGLMDMTAGRCRAYQSPVAFEHRGFSPVAEPIAHLGRNALLCTKVVERL